MKIMSFAAEGLLRGRCASRIKRDCVLCHYHLVLHRSSPPSQVLSVFPNVIASPILYLFILDVVPTSYICIEKIHKMYQHNYMYY